MPTPDEIRAAVAHYVDTFNRGDRDAWLANFTADARQDDPVGAPSNIGHAAIGAFYDNLVAGFGVPSVSLVHDPIVCGNEVVMAMRAESGQEGAKVALPLIIDHLVFDDDLKITSLRAFWDASTIVPA